MHLLIGVDLSDRRVHWRSRLRFFLCSVVNSPRTSISFGCQYGSQLSSRPDCNDEYKGSLKIFRLDSGARYFPSNLFLFFSVVY